MPNDASLGRRCVIGKNNMDVGSVTVLKTVATEGNFELTTQK